MKDLESRLAEKTRFASLAECWLFTGCKNAEGYGRIGVKWPVVTGAHRAAWLVTHGSIPSDLEVCHSCDNPGCVNPSHLFLGTHLENIRDMVRKGRQSRKGCAHKLDQETADSIRQQHKDTGLSKAAIAKMRGLSAQMVGRIVRGVAW